MFNKLFPVNRQFASHVQLGQVVSQFSELWAFGITKSGQAIQCHFGQPTYKKRSKNIRKHDESMKDCIKCPFKINYSLIGKKTSIRKRVNNGNSGLLPKVYYKVSISSTNSLHTCCLNTSYHRIDISNSSTFDIDPQKFNSIILELKDRPTMKPCKIEKRLKRITPSYLLKRENFFSNFRNRVLNYIMRNTDVDSVSKTDCTSFVNLKASAANELLPCNTPIHQQN